MTKAQNAAIAHSFLAKLAAHEPTRTALNKIIAKAVPGKSDHDSKVAALITKSLKLETPLTTRDMTAVKQTIQGIRSKMSPTVWNILAGGGYDSPGGDERSGR